MKNFENLLSDSLSFGFSETELETCLNTLYRIDCEKLSQSFFACRKERIIPTALSGAASRIGFYPFGFYPYDEFFVPSKKEFAAASVPPETGFLSLFVYMAAKTGLLFKNYAIPDDIFSGNIKHIAACSARFSREHGYFGVDDYVWLCGFLIPRIFCIGQLQFNLSYFSYDDITVHGRLIRNGDCIINVHVPDGADLSTNALKYTYKSACDQFGTNIFTVDSWLLYPEHKNMLAPDSAILNFAGDYTVIESSETYDYEGLFRVFGKTGTYDYENLPKHTSLQRAYAERVRKGLPVGSGVGIMCFDD